MTGTLKIASNRAWRRLL